ncbi:hypothetical protein NDA01_19860 [Trichocoleus desertorum AS-A10]|uniref:hypothetical protein n=1 Tax=Trichocoleus desertorum TaxID=1481672 RepID=UPI00329719AB
MSETLIDRPRFRLKQRVRFMGGEGIVRNYEPDSGTWTYLIEMPLGTEPEFGRVGAETRVLLSEVDLCGAY